MNKATNANSWEHLSGKFTEDAWNLIAAFFNNLNKKMKMMEVNSERQNIVFNGLSEFITEYIEDNTNKSKINYDGAITILQEIGPPSEIFQSMDLGQKEETIDSKTLKQPPEDQVKCLNCSWINAQDAKFCENCGKEIISKQKLTQYYQKIIDHPYTATFILTYALLLLIGILISSILVVFNPTSDTFPNYVSDTFSTMIIPSILACFIFGYIIDSKFDDLKSFKARYRKLLDDFDGSFALGLVLIEAFFLSFLFMIVLYNVNTIIIGIFFSGQLLLVPILVGILLWNWFNKTEELSYFVLLKIKKNYELKIKTINRKLLPVALVVSTVWVLFIHQFIFPSYLTIDNPSSIILSGIFIWFFILIGLLSLFNGMYLLSYYSWRTIKNSALLF